MNLVVCYVMTSSITSPLVAASDIVVSINRFAVGCKCFVELLLYEIHILKVVFLQSKRHLGERENKTKGSIENKDLFSVWSYNVLKPKLECVCRFLKCS